MPIPTLRIKVEGDKRLLRKLRKANPKLNRGIMTRALLRDAFLVQKITTEEKILRGGKSAPIHPSKVTSRKGGAGLVGSIGVDRGGTPFFIDIGSDLVYAPVHELGSATHPKRAFLAPAAEDASKSFPEILLDEWRKAVFA